MAMVFGMGFSSPKSSCFWNRSVMNSELRSVDLPSPDSPVGEKGKFKGRGV